MGAGSVDNSTATASFNVTSAMVPADFPLLSVQLRIRFSKCGSSSGPGSCPGPGGDDDWAEEVKFSLTNPLGTTVTLVNNDYHSSDPDVGQVTVTFDDAAKIAPGICGCGVSDVDTNGDSVSDCKDGCPLNPFKTAPGACGCNVADTDSDGDGTPDCLDSTPDGDDDGSALVCDFLPWLVSPADDATDVSLVPTLEIALNLDPVNCGVHRETRWQISETPGFEILLYNVEPLVENPALHQVEQGVLKADTTYYWRARVGCGSGCLSDYAEAFAFTTGPDVNDDNNNGMPDDQEVDDSGSHSRSIRTVVAILSLLSKRRKI